MGTVRHQETGPAAPLIRWEEVAVLVWPLTRPTRDHLHDQHGCRSRFAPYGPADPDASRVPGTCQACGCLDHMHDVLLATMTRLQRADFTHVDDLPRFVTRVARNEIVELKRHQRVALGYPARPSRADGIPGRVIAALQQSEPGERAWRLQLFRILRSYPYTEGRREACWPLDGLTLEKCQLDGRARIVGSVEARCEIRHDIDDVLHLAAEVAGCAWVHETIVAPLSSFREPAVLDELVAI